MKKVLNPSFIFFGTRELGAIVLKHLLARGYFPSLVVTGPDKPAGRKQLLTPSPVKVVAEKYRIPVFQSESIRDTTYKILDTRPDLIVLAAYGNILPKELVGLPPRGALNVHPSLLPKYRGPSPERSALLNGDEKTGVTVMLMDEQVDHGPILAQREFVIPKDIRHEELHAALGELGGKLLVETIPGWLEGTIVPKAQDHSKATYTKKLTKEDGRIDWTKPAGYIERQVRALYPWPGTFTKLKVKSEKLKVNDEKIVKIIKATVSANETGTPGKTFVDPEGKLAVYTGKGALLIEELQLEGGRPMSSKEFFLGHKEFINAQLF